MGDASAFVTAQDGFQFLATMNPGGDYGKKEVCSRSFSSDALHSAAVELNLLLWFLMKARCDIGHPLSFCKFS